MSEETQEEIKIVSKHTFFFETPLYEKIKNPLLEQRLFRGDVDAYSSSLQDNTTYEIEFEWVDNWSVWEAPDHKSVGYGQVTLTCKRKGSYPLRFFVFRDTRIEGFVEKIGQDPSMADIQFSALQQKYEKVLEEEYLREFKRAVGLASHGIGVGSFIYLRRIFENLIYQTYREHDQDLKIEAKEFQGKKMDEKIDALKPYLPSQLLEMKSIYGILSKGVHELDDKVCLEYFAPLKLSIELILDQKIEEKKKEEKDALVKNELQKIQQGLQK
tara:strand:+ start:62433 stop:63245 length:813 start_codon:yes stop_codon:yes gene_type:complete